MSSSSDKQRKFLILCCVNPALHFTTTTTSGWQIIKSDSPVSLSPFVPVLICHILFNDEHLKKKNHDIKKLISWPKAAKGAMSGSIKVWINFDLRLRSWARSWHKSRQLDPLFPFLSSSPPPVLYSCLDRAVPFFKMVRFPALEGLQRVWEGWIGSDQGATVE